MLVGRAHKGVPGNWAAQFEGEAETPSPNPDQAARDPYIKRSFQTFCP